MGDRKIGIRELTSTPSECVRQVKSVETASDCGVDDGLLDQSIEPGGRVRAGMSLRCLCTLGSLRHLLFLHDRDYVVVPPRSRLCRRIRQQPRLPKTLHEARLLRVLCPQQGDTCRSFCLPARASADIPEIAQQSNCLVVLLRLAINASSSHQASFSRWAGARVFSPLGRADTHFSSVASSEAARCAPAAAAGDRDGTRRRDQIAVNSMKSTNVSSGAVSVPSPGGQGGSASP